MKILVEIDLGDRVTLEELNKHRLAWFPITNDKNMISIDRAGLTIDPNENSFCLFKLVGVVPEINDAG